MELSTRQSIQHRSILTLQHRSTMINIQQSIDNHLEESIDSSPAAEHDDWPAHCYPSFALIAAIPSEHTYEYDADYKEERAIEYHGLLTEEDRVLHHSYGIRNAPSIDRSYTTSIDAHHH